MAEKWDLFDAGRNPLNRTHSRNEQMTVGEYHQVVEIWTLNSMGEVLLTLRHPDKRDYPNLWENTGGSVLSGETSLDGAVRELAEETGIRAQADMLRLIDSVRVDTYFLDTYALVKDVEIDELTMQDGETSDAQWVSVEKLHNMMENGLLAQPVVDRYWRVSSQLDSLMKNALME